MTNRYPLALALILAIALPLSAQCSKETTVQSTDGLLQISVPADWGAQELNEAAEIQTRKERKPLRLEHGAPPFRFPYDERNVVSNVTGADLESCR